ncbi:tetratricopeptide repeat protein [Pseudobacteriovorax antillogorgiicola]|nr:tetratricopeptide repeat protein [Pseudobacteriovorax antillogorgiicola]
MKILRLWLALIVLPMVYSPAAYTQEQKRAVLDVKERKRVKRDRQKVQGPRLSRSAMFSVRVERKLIKGIDKTVRYLQKTAKSLPKKSPQKLQIQERILNLYMEQATYVRSEEERRYDQQWKRWEARGRKGPEPQMTGKQSLRYWKLVVKQSSDILKEFPKARTADTITYNKAAALQYLGKEKDAARIFNQLIRNYPNSEVTGDAYASLGDYFFERNDYRNAQKNFKKALKYKRSKRYLWSVFKLGWCSFNLSNYRRALGYWKKLVRDAGRTNQKGASQLKEEALRDMVYAFAELKQIEQAISYYRANGGKNYIGPFLTLLAQILADQGEYKKAIKVLKRFQTTVPYDPTAPEAQKEIVSLNAALGNYNETWKELGRFPALYGPRSGWARRNEKNLVAETQSSIKDQMIYYASLTHQKAIKDNNRALNQEAKKGYLLFLKNYPTAPEVPGIKYYLGDIEYYLKNYQEAGKYYAEIASLGKQKAVRFNPKTKKNTNIHKEVSIYMVNSFVKDFEPEFKVLKKRKPDFSKPRPISSRAQNYIKACNKYVAWYPRDKKRVKSCDTGIANIYYHSGHKKDAIGYLKKLALQYPKDKEGPNAIELLIPMMANDRKELLQLSYRFLKVPAYRKGKMGAKLRGLQRGAEKEAIGQEKDLMKRAQRYEAQARKYPKDPDVDKLWYNAAVDYIKAGAIPNAITAYLVIVKRFPRKPQAQESLLQVAQIYERVLDFDKASSYFLQYHRKYPKTKEAAGALARACELQLALNTSKALQVCNGFANRYPDGAMPYVERLILGAFRAKRSSQMVQIINNIYLPKFKLTANQKIIAYYRIYSAYGGQGSQAGRAVSNMRAEFSRNPNRVNGEALRYIGELAFKQADPILAQYLKVRLVGGTVEKLLASIQNKAAMLQKLEQTYAQVVNTKDSYWGTAALHQIGVANEQFANLLANPPGIQGAKKEDVIKQLGPQIQQIRAAAANWYKTAQQTVTQYKVYNNYSVRVINAIARINGSKFQFDDYVVTPDFMGSELPASIVNAVQGD